jgi:hypothetical protein
MFDSRQYEFADITVFMAGRDVVGLRGISYTSKIEREPLHGKGRYPMSIQSGNVTFEGSIKLVQSELEGLQNAGKGSILSLTVDITVSYGNPSNGDPITSDVIKGVRFTEEPKEYSQGDKFMEIEIPFICIRILNGIKS